MDINELMKPIQQYKEKRAKFDGTCQASNFINLLDVRSAISFLEKGYPDLALERLRMIQKDLETLLDQAKELDAEFSNVFNGGMTNGN